MQLNTELHRHTAPQANAALPRPPMPAEQLDFVSVVWMWVILILSWLLYLSLRVFNAPTEIRRPPAGPPSVPITPCEVRERRQRN
jgi:hypothetical protein